MKEPGNLNSVTASPGFRVIPESKPQPVQRFNLVHPIPWPFGPALIHPRSPITLLLGTPLSD